MSALPEVTKNKGKVKIITTDVLAPELPFVKEGYVQALVGTGLLGLGLSDRQHPPQPADQFKTATIRSSCRRTCRSSPR